MKPMYENQYYTPITPQPDTDELAAKGNRLMLKHGLEVEPHFTVAEKDYISAGWVIGIFD